MGWSNAAESGIGCHGLTRRASRANRQYHHDRMPHRKTLRRYEVEGHARFLTFSCRDRLPLFETDWIKDRFADRLFLIRERLNMRLHAWVIMPEHVHLLITPDLAAAEVSKILSTLKRPFSTSIRHELIGNGMNIPSRFWQPGGGYDRNIFSVEEYREKIEYLHANPVRRGLVASPQDWPWSSFRAYHNLDTRWQQIDLRR